MPSSPVFVNAWWSTVTGGPYNIGVTTITVNDASALVGLISTGKYIPAWISNTASNPEAVKFNLRITAVSGNTLTVERAYDDGVRFPDVQIQNGWTVFSGLRAANLQDFQCAAEQLLSPFLLMGA